MASERPRRKFGKRRSDPEYEYPRKPINPGCQL